RVRRGAPRLRLGGDGEAQHVGGRGHLEIQRLGNLGLQPRHVLVTDVAAVLAQMRGDAVGAGLDRGKRGAHRIGARTAPGIAERCDVIDIDAKAQRWSFGHCFDSQPKRWTTPHPEVPRSGVSKDAGPYVASWFETAQERLFTMRVYHM